MYAHRDRVDNGARVPSARRPLNAAGPATSPLLTVSAMQAGAGNAATAAVLSGAVPVQRAPLPVQRTDKKGKRRERSPLTEEELQRLKDEEDDRRALERAARMHERGLRRAAEQDPLPLGPMQDPFGGHTNKKGYSGDKGPLAVTNKQRHPGSGKFSERYYEDRPGKPSGFMSHLTNEDIGVSLEVLKNLPPDQDAIDSMDATRRRASSTLYGAASSEEQRHPGSNKMLRSALNRQKSGKSLRRHFKDDFPMAGSSKYDGPSYGAQAMPKLQSGKTKLSKGARETLLEMSESSEEDDRGRRASREPEIVEARPRRRSVSAGPSSRPTRPAPVSSSSRHYPPSASRSAQLGGGGLPPLVRTAEPPRERHRSSSRQGRSSSRAPLPGPPPPQPMYSEQYQEEPLIRTAEPPRGRHRSSSRQGRSSSRAPLPGPPPPQPMYSEQYQEEPLVRTVEPPRERHRASSRQGRSSSRAPHPSLPLRPAPMPHPQDPYGGPPPMPYQPSPYGGPPPMPPQPSPYGRPPSMPPQPAPYAPQPSSEPVYVINGRPCVRRAGMWVPIG